MDNRLIPPSHFDPSEQDSLEATPSSATGFPAASVVPLQATTGANSELGQYLCRPADFSPANFNLNAENARIPPINVGRQYEITPDHYRTPPQITRNRGFSAIPEGKEYRPLQHSNIPENYPELIRLQAENEALKTVIQFKKAKMESQVSQRSSKDQSSAHQAVIEHQTQHIARLQKDIDEQRLLLAKKDGEIAQYESSVANKEKENHKLNGSIEFLEAQLNKKSEEDMAKDQEIEDLHNTIRELRTEKEELLKCHSVELDSMKRKCKDESEVFSKDATTKMQEISSAHSQEKIQLESKIASTERKHKKEVEELTEAHQVEKEKWENRVQETTRRHELELKKLATDLNEQKYKAENFLKSLTQAKLENEKLQATYDELKSALESSQQTCENHLTRIDQLQSYIGQQQSEDYERSQWIKHKQQYEESIMALQTEKETMTKTSELQNVRLQSITKILTTQEEAINANTKAFSTGNIKGNPVHVVIRRWREKVFELMVQSKSNEITMKSIEDKFNLTQKDLKEELEEERRVSVILENQLSECKAQLEIQQRENGLLFTKTENLSKKLSESTKTTSELEETIVAMSEQVAKSTSELCQHFQEKFTTLAEKTVHIEQRLVFANNRMRTLHDLIVRRENLWKAKLKSMKDGATKTAEPTQALEKDITVEIQRPDLVAEIERLTEERNSLSHKLSIDSATFESATENFKVRESKLENDLTALQSDVQNKLEEIAMLKIQLDDMQEKLKDRDRVASDATENAKLAQENQKNAIEQKLEEAWKTWDNDKRDLEKRLEESQREHARTVVTSRQSERNAIREKKRAAENLEAVTEEHKTEIEKLQTKMKSLKRDNNLLMTTLRQQGLISTFKAARSQAKKEEHQPQTSHSNHSSPARVKPIETTTTPDDESPQLEPTCLEFPCGQTSGNAGPSNFPDSGNVAEMLKDLVVLTENILQDSD